MSLKTTVKRLEKELAPVDDVIVYFPIGLDGEDSGMINGIIKVINWSKPGWEEIITREEHDRRIAAAIASGKRIVGPGWGDEL